jgi:D-beta-D-heptose 7-phosphate kinase/D-beta-D-heptose 1-phosphate adenosyltransferase
MDVSSLFESFPTTRILCVGDIMIDCFIKGKISRISPEAPIPVLHTQDEMVILGGAGNVVRNLEALGASVTFLSVVGDDREATSLETLLKTLPKVTFSLLKDKTRTTTLKTRFIADNQQVLRTDREHISPIHESLEDKLINLFKQEISKHDLVILSDYAKGVLTPRGLQALIKEAKAHNKPVLIDPKGRDYTRYNGATLLTPNHHELIAAMGISSDSDKDLVEAAQKALKLYDLQAIIVTRGAQGMTLVKPSGSIEHLPTKALEVFDVSGAGDTVIATIAIALAAGATHSEATSLANTAAGIVVGKVGTAVVHPQELLEALHEKEIHGYEEKIVSRERAVEIVNLWKRRGQDVAFTNGCFDLLHPGHVSLLKQSKARANKLIIGLNTDHSVQRLKGPTRPVQQEIARAFVLSSLECVDLVVLFDEDTPLELIQDLKPDVLVKGADYTIDQVVGASFVQSYGGEVFLVNLIEGQSTTNIISKMAS